jgi:trigger factor
MALAFAGNVIPSMDIQITTKKSEGVERLLEVSVPVEAVREVEEKTTRRYASTVRLPGFRPGKVPPAVVRKRFKDAIRQQVIETILNEAFQQVVQREGFRVAAQPHVHDIRFADGEPLTFELHVEIRPEIELARLSGFRLKRGETEVSEEQIREQLEQLRDQRAAWSPSEQQPAPGDMVTVELATAEDGGEVPEAREYRIVLGGGQAIAGIEELIMELAPGQSAERPVRWPEDFPDEAQRGKTKVVRVVLRDVKRKSLPELDDAFAREVGDFESLEALRAAIERDLRDHVRREADAAVRSQLLDEIAAANRFDVPQSWVSQLIDGYMQAYKIPEAERERFAAEFRGVAERQVRRDLIVDTIAEREKLSATEADIDNRVAEVASKRNADPGQVYASLQKGGRLKEIEHSITQDKVFAWLLERNTVE